uniref:hypothetical protein n=1 Tax=Salmonella sp. TaxID=599 RepID=UPI001CDA2DC3|nr:hypothetical protein [Salmonella sp.]
MIKRVSNYHSGNFQYTIKIDEVSFRPYITGRMAMQIALGIPGAGGPMSRNGRNAAGTRYLS